MRSGVQVCEKSLLAEACGQNLAITAGCYSSAGVDRLDHTSWVESRLDIGLVRHFRDFLA